jgi:hypothetical protein
MANYQQLRQTLVQALLGTVSPASAPTDDLIALINALPIMAIWTLRRRIAACC